MKDFLPETASQTAGPYVHIGLAPDAAVQLINRAKAVVVDVCEADEFAAGHVVGAKNVPFSELEKKLTAVVKNKGVPLIIVCQSGARSGRAVALKIAQVGGGCR